VRFEGPTHARERSALTGGIKEVVMAEAVIIDAVRTPLGKGRPGGALTGVHPVDLLAHPLAALVERTGLDPQVIEHWAQSEFANTDLDAQLKQLGIEKIILVGFVANTCVEGTARFGMQRGYHVTLIRDATAAFDREGMRAAHEVNGPRFAHAMLSTDELLARLPR
jgi:nicotinamidase-related amidase